MLASSVSRCRAYSQAGLLSELNVPPREKEILPDTLGLLLAVSVQ
jgi:hypothetical protein